MDGSATPRSDMASKFAKWSNGNPDLWKSRPVKGDIGIVFAPESERFNFAQQGNTANYAASARGAYEAFFDSNIQPDWVHIDNIDEYPLVYLPYPVMLTAKDRGKGSRLRAKRRNADQRRTAWVFRRRRACRRNTAEPRLGRSIRSGRGRCRFHARPAGEPEIPRSAATKLEGVTLSRSIDRRRAKRPDCTRTARLPRSRISSARAGPS